MSFWLAGTQLFSLTFDPETYRPGQIKQEDGAKFGFPVFPINWDGSDGDEPYPGFREEGFLPDALLNFLAFLGWNPGNDEEILHRAHLIELFSLDRIVKSGARFDYDKAKWYNQQYLMAMSNEELAVLLTPLAKEMNIEGGADKLAHAAGMMKERVYFYKTSFAPATTFCRAA